VVAARSRAGADGWSDEDRHCASTHAPGGHALTPATANEEQREAPSRLLPGQGTERHPPPLLPESSPVCHKYSYRIPRFEGGELLLCGIASPITRRRADCRRRAHGRSFKAEGIGDASRRAPSHRELIIILPPYSHRLPPPSPVSRGAWHSDTALTCPRARTLPAPGWHRCGARSR
jgi:hypothetical protein